MNTHDNIKNDIPITFEFKPRVKESSSQADFDQQTITNMRIFGSDDNKSGFWDLSVATKAGEESEKLGSGRGN